MLCPKSYHESEICGTYYVVEHGLDISNEIHKPVKAEFMMNGEILKYRDQSAESVSKETYAKPIGSFTLSDESCITLNIGENSYEGVIVQLNDEAGNPTMCITGVGANQSAWAVRYL